MFAGIAEFERHLIRSRTEDGRRAQATLARELVHEGKSNSEVARTFNVHPATIYRCLEDEQGL